MSTNYTIITFILVISMLFIQCNNKDTNYKENSAEPLMEEKHHKVVGGWKSMEINQKIKDLSDYIIKEYKIESSIKSISNASYQIVSGKNYRFEIALENGEIWKSQVYLNFKNEPSITTFQKISKNEK